VLIPGGFEQSEVTIDYTYEPLYRLTAADYSTGDFYHYAYDAVGNRLTQESTVSGLPSTVNYTACSAVVFAALAHARSAGEHPASLTPPNFFIASASHFTARRTRLATESNRVDLFHLVRCDAPSRSAAVS
jgi:hypothetical protein